MDYTNQKSLNFPIRYSEGNDYAKDKFQQIWNKRKVINDYNIEKISSLNEKLLEVISRQSSLSQDYKFIIKTALSGLSGLMKLQFMIKKWWYKIKIKMTKMIKMLNIIDLWARYKTRRWIKGVLDQI